MYTPPPQEFSPGEEWDSEEQPADFQQLNDTRFGAYGEQFRLCERSTASTIKLDYILSRLESLAPKTAFDTHGVTDLWLPFPKQTLRHFLKDPQDQQRFLQFQNDIIHADLTRFHTTESGQNQILFHTAFDDDDTIVSEPRILGEGGCGTVEEVLVSTKPYPTICVRKKIGRPRQLQAQKKIITAFAREIGVMRQVGHLHCVRFVGSYTDLDSVNILSLPVADMDLAAFMNQKSLTEQQKRMLYQGMNCLCNALNYLHQRKIRHEDLKPQNVLVHGENMLLTDFGFSLDFSDDISTTTGRPFARTARYAAPEVLEHEPRNRATDIWSLGCILIEMISAYLGHSLSDVMNHWKRVGNGEFSFARNTEATTSWVQFLMRGNLEIDAVCSLSLSTLNPERLLRPSAEQIMDRLSDLSIFLPNSQLVAGCCARQSPYIPADIRTYLSVKWNPGYIYPWCKYEWTYILLDLDLYFVDSKHECYSRFREQNILKVFERSQAIRSECESLYAVASRTGANRDFWEARRQRGQKLRTYPDGYKYAIASMHILPLKHIVFTAMWCEIRLPMGDLIDSPLSESFTERMIQISLLPICLPRSPCFGSFFYMISFPTENSGYFPSVRSLPEVVDLSLVV